VTAQGEDLLAWLDRAITARAQAAQEAARSYGPRWVRPVDTDVVRVSDDGVVWFQALSDEIAEHVIHNSPETVLRRCAADRKLIALHNTPGNVFPDGSYLDDNRWCVGCGYGNDGEPLTSDVNDCPTLHALALGYGWMGGER
jgi:hypothetical protein